MSKQLFKRCIAHYCLLSMKRFLSIFWVIMVMISLATSMPMGSHAMMHDEAPQTHEAHHEHMHHGHDATHDMSSGHTDLCDEGNACDQAQSVPACCSMMSGHCALVLMGTMNSLASHIQECEAGLLPGRDQLLIGQHPEAETPPPRS